MCAANQAGPSARQDSVSFLLFFVPAAPFVRAEFALRISSTKLRSSTLPKLPILVGL